MRSPFACLLFALAITGCHAGTQIENYVQARRAEGVSTDITLRKEDAGRKQIEGELLEVRQDGLLLNVRESIQGESTSRHLVFVPYAAMKSVEVEKTRLRLLDNKWNGVKASREDRETLRLLSRFPQGLSSALLEQLLAAEDQDAVDLVGTE